MIAFDGDVKYNSKILIVDDQKVNRELSKFFLKNAGYQKFAEASNGVEALNKVSEFKPDIILLDILMPEMNGFDVCEKLKSDPETASIPIIFLSSLSDLENRTKGYRLGAVDYVNKPIDQYEMTARVDVHLLNGVYLKQLSEYHNRVSDELNRARRLQQDLLPSSQQLIDLKTSSGITIDQLYRASQELAGDYWNIYPLKDGKYAFVIMDFTGHGVVAALNTVRAHSLFLEMEDILDKPEELVKRLNDRLHLQLPAGTFATLVYAVLDPEEDSFTYIGCGHPAFAHCTEKGIQMVDCSGFPVGLGDSSDLQLTEKTIKLSKGDQIFFYSDALIETEHEDGTMWLDQDLSLLIKDALAQPAPLIPSLLSKFKETSKEIKDDLTMVNITY